MDLHPLYRFEVAAAILTGRTSLFTTAEVDALPQGAFFSETARAYYDLLVGRLTERRRTDTTYRYPAPKFNMTRGMVAQWSPSQRSCVELSWVDGKWQFRTYGLRWLGRPTASAVRWIVSGGESRLPQSARNSRDFYTRMIAVLAAAGTAHDIMLELGAQRPRENKVLAYLSAWRLISDEAAIDDLFRRALGAPVLAA